MRGSYFDIWRGQRERERHFEQAVSFDESKSESKNWLNSGRQQTYK